MTYNNTETVCHVDFMEYAESTYTGDFESLTVNIRAMPGLPSYMTSEIEVATPNVTIASTASLRIVPRDGQVRSSTSLAHHFRESASQQTPTIVRPSRTLTPHRN